MKSSILCLLLAPFAAAFAPINGKTSTFVSQKSIPVSNFGGSVLSPINQRELTYQRQSNTQLYGLFGLGGPEIAVILVAAAFLLGPEKLAEFGKDAGKIAGELKEVPKEFQAGLAEGEQNAKAMKAKSAEVAEEVSKED